jgi:hypothetical protein
MANYAGLDLAKGWRISQRRANGKPGDFMRPHGLIRRERQFAVKVWLCIQASEKIVSLIIDLCADKRALACDTRSRRSLPNAATIFWHGFIPIVVVLNLSPKGAM